MRKLIEEYGQVIIAVLAILALIFIIGPLGSLIGSGVEGNVNSMVNGITGDIPDGGGGGPSYTYDVIATSESGKQLDHYTVTYGVGSSNLIRPKTIDGYITPQSQMIPWDSETKTINFKYDMVDYALSVDLNGGTCTDQSTIPSTYTVEDAPITLPSDVKRGDEVFMGYSGSGLTTLSKNVTIPTGSTGNRTYIANFKKAEYVNISFDSRGGSKVETQRIIKGGSLESLPTPTRLGYDFVGWYDGYDKVEITKTFDKDVQLVAKWKAKHLSRTVIYQSSVSNKELKRSMIEYDFGQQVTINGINITGYKKTSDYVFNADMNVEDIIIRCVPEVYTITYNLNGGAFDKNVTSTTSYTIEAQDISIPDAMREGHTFTGWTDNKGAVKVKNYIIKSGTTGNITLTANYDINTYRLSFNANGGSCNEQYQDLKYGTLLTNLPTPTRSGYTFIGWFDAKDGGKQYTARNKMPAGNMTLYAHWRGNILTINYHLNGGTDVPSDNDFTSAEIARTEKYTYPNTLNSYGLNNASIDRVTPPTGYSDCGYYNTQADGKGKELNADTAYELTDIDANILLHDATVDIYAQWKPNSYTYNIVYESTSGKQLGTATLSGLYGDSKQVTAPEKTGYMKPAAQVIKWDSVTAKTVKFIYTPIQYAIEYELNGGNGTNVKSYTIETPTFSLKEPTKVGHKFSGWIGSNGNTPNKVVTINKGSTGNKKFTANWSANTYTYDVIYQSTTGKQISKTTVSGTYGSSKTVNPANYNGYTKPASQTVVFDSVDGKTIKFTYTLIDYTIVYDLNGGSASNKTTYNIETPSFSLNAPVKAGYTFTGWTGSNSSSAQKDVMINTGSYGNKTYTANWKANTYTLTYKANGGNGADVVDSIAYDSNFTVRANMFIKTGYRFIGWNTDPNGNGEYWTTKIGTTAKWDKANNVILYAIWKKNTFNFDINAKVDGDAADINGKVLFDLKIGDKTLKGISDYQDVAVVYGTEYEISNIRAQEGYIYNGITSDSKPLKGTVTGSNIVYLDFTTKSITIKLHRNTSTSDSEVVSKTFKYNGSDQTLPTVTWSKTDYSLTGWAASSTAINAEFAPTATVQNSYIDAKYNEQGTPIDLYAVWKLERYTVTFDVQGGQLPVGHPESKQYAVGQPMGVLPVPTKKGREFAGWYTQPNGAGQKVNEKSTFLVPNTTIYARWVSYELTNGMNVNSKLKEVDAINKIKSIEFVDTEMPTTGVTEIKGLGNTNESIVKGWYTVDTADSMAKVYISSQKAGQKVIANADCLNMFNGYISYNNYVLDKVKIINVGSLDTSNVLSMNKMFYYVGYNSQSFNVDLSQWNVSNVTTMSNMFASAGRNATTWNIGNLSQWNVSNVTTMSNMFYYAGDKATTWNIGDLSQWNVGNVTNMSFMFSGTGDKATTWNIGDLSQWNVSNVTNMRCMFSSAGYNATTFNIGDLSQWNVGNVTDMGSMFPFAGYNATTFNIGDLSKWDVSSVTDMGQMFSSAGYKATTFNIGDLSQWNVGNVTNMINMFYYAGYNTTTFNIGDLSKWNVSKVTNMSSMFYLAGYKATTFNIGDLSQWNVGNVTNMSNMFYYAGYNTTTFNIGDLSQWNVGNVTNMNNMFRNAGYNATPFTLNLSGWDVSNVTNMQGMFNGVGANKILTPKNISSSVELKHSSYPNNTSYWITERTWYNLTENGKEYPAGTFPVGNGNVSHTLVDKQPKTTELVNGSAINMKLYEVDKINDIKSIEFTDITMPSSGVTIIPGIDADGDGGVVGWYTIDPSDNLTKVYFSTQNPDLKIVANKDSSNMFRGVDERNVNYYLYYVKLIDAEKLDTSKVTNMQNMFYQTGFFARSFVLKVSQWDVSNVIDMSSMFCSAGYNAMTFNIDDLSQWNVSSVTDMSSMFEAVGPNATTWNIGDLSKWNVSNVTNMSGMFTSAGYKAATWNIGDLSNWDVSGVTDMIKMFNDAGNNATTWSIGSLSAWNVSNVTSMFYMFYGAGGEATTWNIGDLSNWDVSSVTNMGYMFYYAGYKATPFTLNLSDWNASNVTSMKGMFNGVGANIILTPKNISSSVELKLSSYPDSKTGWVTERAWYDLTENGKEYPAGTFPVGNGNVSHTLVDEKPEPTYVLTKGTTVNQKLKEIDAINKIKSIEFVDTTMPASGVTAITGLDADGDDGVVGWYTIDPTDSMTKVYISTQKSGQKVIANVDCSNMFNGYISYNNYALDKVKIINVGNLDTSNVISMNRMFLDIGYNSQSFNVDLSQWNVSNVTDMSSMFASAGRNATTWNIGNLSQWNVSNVTTMSDMFYYAGRNATTFNIGDLSKWNVGNVTDMDWMFYYAGRNATTFNIGDLSKWDVSNVTNMSYMFSGTGDKATTWNIGDLSQWNVSNVSNMTYMFYYAGYNAAIWNIGDLSSWNVSNVMSMLGMFSCAGYNAAPFTLDLSGWNASNVTNMQLMFNGVGANKILTPKNIRSDVSLKKSETSYLITERSWYDLTDNGKEYPAGTFPVGNGNTSHTLVDEKPYSITYELDGGVLPSEAPTYYLSSEGLDKLPIPTKADGAKFIGWIDKELRTLGNVISAINPSNGYQVEFTEDIILNYKISGKRVAKNIEIFDLNNIRIAYNGGSQSTIEGSFELPAGVYKITTFEVQSWDISLQPKQMKTAITPNTTGNMVLEAIWSTTVTFELPNGLTFNTKMKSINSNNRIKSIIFTDTPMPLTGVTPIEGLDSDNDGGVVGWYKIDLNDNKTFVYISTKTKGVKVKVQNNTFNMFKDLNYVELLDAVNLDVSALSDFSYMFFSTGSAANSFALNITGWDVSNAINMDYMFYNIGNLATNWSIDGLSHLNTCNVKSMQYMFEKAGYNTANFNLGSLDNWDVSNVQHMNGMFNSVGYSATNWNIGNLSSWNVGNVIDTGGMFQNAAYNAITWNIGDLSQWNVINVTNMSNMFNSAGINSEYLLNLKRWNVVSVESHSLFNSRVESKIIEPVWVK